MQVEKANRATIYPIIEKHVEKGSSVYTDDHKIYDSLHGALTMNLSSTQQVNM